MDDIDISIVIRAKNEEKNVKKCLENIFKQKIDKKFEVMIVDNESTDNTLKIASQYPCKIVKISSEEFTYPRALNVGIQHSKGEYCVFISMDAYPADEKWLYYLLAPFSDSLVAAVYGRQIPIPKLNPIEETELLIGFPNYKPKEHDVASSANCAMRRDLLEKYPFIEKVEKLEKNNKLGGEDGIWKMMIENKGYKTVYEPRAIVYHTHPLSIKYIKKRYGDYYNIGYALAYFGSPSSVILKNTSLAAKIPKTIKNIKNEFLYLLKHNYYLYIFPYFLFRITMLFRVLYGYHIGRKDKKKVNKIT